MLLSITGETISTMIQYQALIREQNRLVHARASADLLAVEYWNIDINLFASQSIMLILIHPSTQTLTKI